MTSPRLEATESKPLTEPGTPDPRARLIEEYESCPIATKDDVAGLTPKLVKCGCGECGQKSHPLAVTDVDDESDEMGLESLTAKHMSAKESCPTPIPVSVEEAGEVFGRFAYAEHGDPTAKRRLNQGRQNYRRLMERDRHARQKFGRSITTVLLTIRPSPQDKRGWRVPITLCRETANATQKLNETAKRYAKEEDFGVESSYVVSGTTVWGTPHGHVLLYLDDPDDRARMSDFAPAINVALNRITSHDDDAHVFDDAGEDGPVVVNHDPDLKDIMIDGLDFSSVYDALRRGKHGEDGGDGDDDDDGGSMLQTPSSDSIPDPTMAAGLYLGTQLAYIRALGAVKDDWTPRGEDAAFQFAGVAWGLRGHDDASKKLSGGTRF